MQDVYVYEIAGWRTVPLIFALLSQEDSRRFIGRSETIRALHPSRSRRASQKEEQKRIKKGQKRNKKGEGKKRSKIGAKAFFAKE